MGFPNPFAFRPLQVTFWTTAVYLAIVTPLVTFQESVPRAPAESALPRGISLDEAWADLGNLTRHFHPVNSHANDDVRSFLIERIHQILDSNGVSWTTQADRADRADAPASLPAAASSGDADAVVFDDLLSNISFTTSYANGRRAGLYYEGSNVYVYIRGTRDAAGRWWLPAAADASPDAVDAMKKQVVLVNAHFDSVSSGYGATDDGVGVVSGLQLIRYFTTPGNQPARGVVVLLNNAEEEFLLGGTAFANSPLAGFIGTFVNLEGAGAGGRAILFRSTDLEVMEAYRKAPHPAGTVVASDGFKLNMIRSETDYRVWVRALGYRGLDIAFMKPRVRYHTQQDDRRHTSRDSVWHMLSAALASAQGLTGAAGDRADRSTTDAVWFDLFGDSLVLFALRGLFAWSVTILVASPLLVALVLFVLYKVDKDYMFRSSMSRPDGDATDARASRVPVGGLKGFFRYPFALVVAGLVVYGAAFLVRKVQPFIIYSSIYAVLSLFASLFYFVFWCIMRGADYSRPSALHRAYSLFWLYLLSWALLVGAAKLQDQSRIASGYIIVFWSTSIFAALLISLLELFTLKTKTAYAEELAVAADAADNASESEILISPTPGERVAAAADDDHDDDNGGDDADDAAASVPTETSPLIGGVHTRGRPTTFATGYHRSLTAIVEERRRVAAAEEASGPRPFGSEQAWSKTLPTWTWLLQFLVLGPFNMIIVGQLLLTVVAAVHQTGTDGSDLLVPYLLVATFSVLLLSPLTPFLHRVTRHVPLLLAGVFVGTLAYCLAAFPFSATSPFKFSIRQTFSVDDGNASVTLNGYGGYVNRVIAGLPSAAGRAVECVDSYGRQTGLLDCTFDATGLEPRVGVEGSAHGPGSPFAGSYDGLISVSARRDAGDAGNTKKITFEVTAANTKACALRFERPVKSVSVRGSLPIDTRIDFDTEPAPADDDGSWQLGDFVLWRRDWETPWVVDVEEEEGSETEGKLSGHVICRWGDANTPGTAPAVDEAWKYAPAWSILVVRQNPPLVQGTKTFSV